MSLLNTLYKIKFLQKVKLYGDILAKQGNKANLSWSPTGAKFCQLAASLSCDSTLA